MNRRHLDARSSESELPPAPTNGNLLCRDCKAECAPGDLRQRDSRCPPCAGEYDDWVMDMGDVHEDWTW